MPSPFPGMDPFIEAEEWGDFHLQFNGYVARRLNRSLDPKYVARSERRVVIESGEEDSRDRVIFPDAFVRDVGGWSPGADPGGGAAVIEPSTRSEVEPLDIDISEQITRDQHYVEIRDAKDRRVITVIETLSPDNKRPGSDGYAKYTRKRESVLDSEASLVEIDLLRGGQSMPHGPTNVGDYRVFISVPWTRPRAKVWPIGLMDRLPTLPIPLREDEEPVPLGLQEIVTSIYEEVSYERSLDYDAPLRPPLPPEVRNWLSERTTHRP